MIDLSKVDPVAVPNGLYIDSVIASCNDTASIGRVLRGIGNRPVPAFITGGISSSVEGMLHNDPASDGTLHCTMLVNELDISEISGSSNTKGFCGLGFELLAETDSGWVRLFEQAGTSEFHGGPDDMDKHALTIRAAFAKGFAEYDSTEKAGALSHTLLPHPPRTGILDEYDRAYPVLISGATASGLYRTFKDFRDQHPDTSFLFTVDPTSAADPLGTSMKLKVERGGTLPKDMWGVSDGKHTYINVAGNHFLRLDREGNIFVAYYRAAAPTDQDAVALGASFGLIGATIFMAVGPHYAPANSRSGLSRTELDLLTGRLKPPEMPKKNGDAEIAMSEHVFIYSHDCAMDTTVNLFVYGGAEASLRQDGYHRLKLVPRENAVPVEVKVGEGARAGIDIAADRTDVTQVYLITVDVNGMPAVAHVDAQTAQALIERLDPAKEVK